MDLTPFISINYSTDSRPQFNNIFSELDVENKQAFSVVFRKTKCTGSDFSKLLPGKRQGVKMRHFSLRNSSKLKSSEWK